MAQAGGFGLEMDYHCSWPKYEHGSIQSDGMLDGNKRRTKYGIRKLQYWLL